MRPRRIEALIIGNELLDGRVVDTNTVRLAAALHGIGLELAQRSTVVDDIEVIVRSARECIARGTDLCLVSGGLGPTSDDLTSEAFAALAGVELVRDAATVEHIEARFRSRGFEITNNQRKQADRPTGAEVIHNPVGTAAGFAIEFEGCRFVCVPGVPREFDVMVAAAIVEPLRAGATVLHRHELRSFGLIEGEVGQRLGPIAERWPGVRVGYRAAFPEIHVTLQAGGAELLEGAVTFCRDVLGRAVFTEAGEAFAAVVLQQLRTRHATLAAAESCTGGLVGDLLTDVPGSSDVFLGSVVAYHNEIKRTLLHVSADCLDTHGAVSRPTVLAMAAGVRERFGATYGVATSGVAGPGGGTADKPVGTLWIAVASRDQSEARQLQLPFERRGNKVVTAHAALDLLRRTLLAD